MATNLAIVTGTSRGIGAAVARLLLERGWSVVGVARSQAILRHELYRHIRCDLADANALSALRTEIAPTLAAKELGRVGLVNNAALTGHLGRTSDLDLANYIEVQTANTAAPMMLMAMLDKLCGRNVAVRVVNVSSGVAVQAFAGMASYSNSKAALRMGGMIMAKEWESNVPGSHRDDAAILSYEPGLVDTDMQSDARSRSKQDFPWVGMFTGFHEQGALVKPERPAGEIVEFLESGKQAYFSERRLPNQDAVVHAPREPHVDAPFPPEPTPG